jgi:hypothetical protein
MIIPPFDASHHDESNKLWLIFLWPLYAEIMWFNYLRKTSFFVNFANIDISKYQGGPMSIGRREMKHGLLDA